MTTQPRIRIARRVKREKRESQGHPRRFSVVLCTYNRRNFVLATLASLRRQTIPPGDFEVIVVDNGSRDGTLQAVQAYLQADKSSARSPDEEWLVQCLAEPKNGLAYARNAGLLAASGEIVVLGYLRSGTDCCSDRISRKLFAFRDGGRRPLCFNCGRG